jgi:ribosomal protein S12 methylthiotransferase accessory factor
MNPEYARALSNFAALTDPKTGIIRKVELIKICERDPIVFVAHADPCDTVPLTGIPAANRGAACSVQLERALIRACGESIERYCSAFFELSTLRIASESELACGSDPFVSVHDVYPFHPDQYVADFPFERVTADRPLRWVRARAYSDGRLTWVPASCVYVPYHFEPSIEPFTHMPISTGLAAGPSVKDCVHKGIFEILERDSLMIVWHGRLECPRIDPSSCRGLSSAIDRLLDAERSGGPRWYLNLLTLDLGVPIVSAVLINSEWPPLTSFGLAAHSNLETALLLALEEASLTRVLINRSAERADIRPCEYDQVKTLHDHLLAHATSSALRDELRFLTDDGPLLSFREAAMGNWTEPVGAVLAGAGFDAYSVDVTTPDIVDFGFHVVRTIIPGLQPLDNDHRHRYLGGRRLYDVPARYGRTGLTIAALNPAPHPFP